MGPEGPNLIFTPATKTSALVHCPPALGLPLTYFSMGHAISTWVSEIVGSHHSPSPGTCCGNLRELTVNL
jgi:hypothetical protein